MYALTFDHMAWVGTQRVQVSRWVPISAEQAIPGQYVSQDYPGATPAGEKVRLTALGANIETVFVSMGNGFLRDLLPGE